MQARYLKRTKTGPDEYVLICNWLFHAITSERKDLSKIHELKTEKSLKQTPTYLVETIDVAAKVVTNRQTDIHTHTRQLP